MQTYVWRWEIEVNHRDEKNILGVGQAQVRGKTATGRVPAFLVASYSMALLAAHDVLRKNGGETALPRPFWQKKGSNQQRPPLQHIVQGLRAELWANALGVTNFSAFVKQHQRGTIPGKCTYDVADPLLYTRH